MNKPIGIRERTRFSGPVETSNVVHRTRLDSAYADAVGSIVRVLAPGGYGKSTLIARWIAREPREVIWLDLERIDNDPLVLMNALASGLSNLGGAGVEQFPGEPRRREAIRDVVVPTFGDLVRTCSVPFVMVLDDIHHLDQSDASAVVDAVASNLPAASTLVLSGRRHRHDEAFAALRLHPGVTDIDVSNLAFDITETEELLTAAGLDLDLGTLTSVADEFEGWPAGLRLATLAMQAQGDHSGVEAELMGGADYVADYLGTQWLASIDPDDRQLLVELGCVGRFTSEMCDTVLGRRCSSEAIHRLRHEQLLRHVPFDRREHWYRMHPLLASWLSAELHERDRDRWREIHLAVSGWWAEAGDIDLAVEHAERAGDDELCESLVTQYGGLYITRGQHQTVGQWLSRLGDERIRNSAGLCAMAAVSAAQTPDGPRVLKWTHALVSSVAAGEREGDGPTNETPIVWSEILTAAIEPRAAADLVESCEHAYQHVAAGPWRAFACWTLGNLYFLQGDPRAVDVLSEGAFEAEVAGAPLQRANNLAAQAIVLDVIGERERSIELARAAHSELHPFRLETLPTTAIVSAVYALVEMRAGRRDTALPAIRTSRTHLAGFVDISPWFNVVTRLALARACLAGADLESGRELVDEIEHHLRFEPDGHGAAAAVCELREHVDAARDALIDRSSTLTAAELRVLRYLPTNLSLADIAGLLYVSRNTVKSHAAAIYRKLGTTSRGDAVDIAHEWGLLDGTQRRTDR